MLLIFLSFSFLKTPRFLYHIVSKYRIFQSHFKFVSTKMYPRVIVRREEQEDDSFTLQDNSNSIPVLKKVPKSPPLHDSTVKENQNDPLPSVAKIPEAYVPKSAMPMFPLSKGPRKNNKHTKELQEDTKLPIRASSILRPRAVISSPDNDKKIGNKNKVISKRPLALKKQSLEQYSTSQVKVNAVHDKAASPLSMRLGTREATQNKSGLKQCNSTKPAVSRQKAFLTKGNQAA